MSGTQAVEPATLAALPSPTDRPGCDIVIYDGACRFCTASAQRLARADRRKRLAFLSLHDAEVARRWPDLTRAELMRDMYVVTPGGRRYRGAEAIGYLSTRLASLAWMAPFLHIPGLMPVWQRVYRTFAGRRYRLGRVESCDDGTCRLPGAR